MLHKDIKGVLDNYYYKATLSNYAHTSFIKNELLPRVNKIIIWTETEDMDKFRIDIPEELKEEFLEVLEELE